MFDIKSVIGMGSDEAQKLLSQAGYNVEVFDPNLPQRLNCEYRRDRVNLEVENGKVTYASIG